MMSDLKNEKGNEKKAYIHFWLQKKKQGRKKGTRWLFGVCGVLQKRGWGGVGGVVV